MLCWKRLLPAPALAFALVLPAAPAAAQPDVPRPGALYEDGHDGRYLLGGEWLLRLDPRNEGLSNGYATSPSTDGWEAREAPFAWNAKDESDASMLGGIAWYRKDFVTPADSQALRWVLRFEAVNYRATVFLNGRKIGFHEGAYLPFEVDGRGLARPGGVNRLVVRVDSRRGKTDLPPGGANVEGRPAGGWWNYGGLTREVYLRRVSGADFRNVHVETRMRCTKCAATITVRATVANRSSTVRRLSVAGSFGKSRLRFGGGARVRAGRTHVFTAKLRLARPKLWSPGSPYRYTTRLQASSGTAARAGYTVHTGIKWLRVTPAGRLLLNGKPVALRGASMHEDDPDQGSALTPAQRRGDVDRLKRLGATITRSHYPLHPYTVELLDQAGILLWNQAPVYQLSVESLRSRVLERRAVREVREMVLRDRNHPSVLTWSIANELPSDASAHARLLEKLLAAVRALDATRLEAIDIQGYPTVAMQPVYRKFDAIGINDYFGWYPGPNGTVADRAALAPYLDQMHRFYPRQALFVTEFGAEANREGPIDEKGTYAFQRDFLRYHLEVFSRRPWINGAIVWILRDFRVKPDWDGGNPKPEPPFNQKGLVSATGVEKPAFAELSRLFRAVR